MFVVTGTPRSATGYMSLLFQALGVPCTHERIFRPRTALIEVLEWCARSEQDGESSWLAWVFLPLMPKPPTVLHVTRNPWQVVDSLARRNDILPDGACLDKSKHAFRDVVKAYCPQVFEYSDAVNRAAALFVQWNRRIERIATQYAPAYHRYQVESLNAERLEWLLDCISLYRDDIEIERALRDVPHNVNAGKRIEYKQEIKNPLIRAYLEEIYPGVEPTLARVYSTDTKRSPEEIENDMAPELREGLNELAAEYGYTKE